MAGISRTALRVIVADGRRLLCDATRALLVHELGHVCVATVEDGVALPERAEHTLAEIALVELGLPPHGGLDAARALRAHLPALPVVLFGARPDRRLVLDALHHGVRAIVSTNGSQVELAEALSSAALGKRYLCHEVATELADALGDGGEATEEGVLARLSEREREVLGLLMTGRSSTECAAVMGLSVHTVETHRRNIMSKCEVHNVVDLVKLALRHGVGVDRPG